ncbi:GGDEF domain-containing protein [Deinococcus sp. PEB2-63]
MTTEHADAQRQIARYRSLVQVIAALSRHVRTEELLLTMHHEVQALFASPITLLARRTPEGGWAVQTLEGDVIAEQWLGPRRDGLLERVVTDRVRLENDLPAYLDREGLTVVRVHYRPDLPHTMSWMGVPLRAGGETLGVLSVQSYALDAFTPEDLEFLELLGVQLGIVMENAALHEQLEREANTDPLTGLFNRRQFALRGEAAGHAAGEWTLAVMDVQKFKRINDELGHATGDVVLRGIGEALLDLTATRGEAFRLGGDEFALLLPCTPERAAALLRAGLDGLAGRALPASPFVNVGLAARRAGEPLTEWVRRADRHMYAAKRTRAHLIVSSEDGA